MGIPRYTNLPLPPYRHLPGETPHPLRDPEGHSYGRGDEPVPFEYAVDLFNHGYYWEAHEAWEYFWKEQAPGTAEAHFLQGLIQIAARHLKERSGNQEGVRKLEAKAAELIKRAAPTLPGPYRGLDAHALAREVAAGRFPVLLALSGRTVEHGESP